METTGVLLADGFEEALIGIGNQCHTPLAVYDIDKCFEILRSRDGMSEEEAVEVFSYNVQGAYVGESTPVFIEVK